VGIRLIVEVLDYAPATLTHREKLLLVALAENADDNSRTTQGSVESAKILRSGMVRRSGLYDVLKSLTAKGAIKRETVGQRNAGAVYVFLPMASQCPSSPDTERCAQCPGFPDTDTPQCPGSTDTENPQCPRIPDTEPKVEGPGIPDTETGVQSPGIPDTETASGPEAPDLDQSQSPENPDTDESQTREKYLSTKRSLLPRPDVDQVCNHLADRIEANGSQRPRVTDRWRDAARLLIDRDGRTVDQILRAIDWCQADSFWRANVLSMPTLRSRYDQLRLRASAEMEQQRRNTEREAKRAARYVDPTERGIF